MKKFKMLLPMLAIILGIAGAFAMKSTSGKTVVLTYYFTGISGQEFDAGQYSVTAPEGGCSGDVITCQFEVPDGYNSISDYMTWLNAQSNKQALYDAQVISKRN